MSKRHRRAIRLLNLTRKWCRQVEKVAKTQTTTPFRFRPSSDLVREIRSR